MTKQHNQINTAFMYLSAHIVSNLSYELGNEIQDRMRKGKWMKDVMPKVTVREDLLKRKYVKNSNG